MNCVASHMDEQREQGFPETRNVRDQDRLGVAAELLPRQLLDQFLQRADSAGQRHECVGALEHQPLALVHIGRDDHFLNAIKGVFADGEEVRDDARHGAAVIEYRGGHRSHQPDRTAAIDEADAVFGESLSKCDGGFDKAGVGTRAGAAIDADGFDFAHHCHVALQRKIVKPSDSRRRPNLSANPRYSRKNCLHKGARGIQTLYMSGQYANEQKTPATADRRIAALQALIDGSYRFVWGRRGSAASLQ